MKNRDELEQLREIGKWVKSKAATLGTMLVHYGAEPTRLLEPEFEYGGQRVSIPAEAADCMVALLLYLTPGSRGRPPRASTSYARFLVDLGASQRTAAHIVAKYTGESPGNIRPRLVARSKSRSRKPQSRKPGSKPR